jgi:hypothetical protein
VRSKVQQPGWALVRELQQNYGRKQNENSIKTDLARETQARQDADDALKSLIAAAGAKAYETYIAHADLPNGNNTTVATPAGVPAGRYLAFAKTWVANQSHGANWACDLWFDDATTGASTYVDQTLTYTTAGNISGNLEITVLSVARVFPLAHDGGMHVDCESGKVDSELNGIDLIAVRVQ